MAKIKVKDSNNQITVKCKLEKYEGIYSRDIQIFQSKLIRGLARPCVEDDKKLSYSIQTGRSLEEFLTSGITKNDFFLVLVQTLEMIKKVEQNAFMINNVMLDLKNVYINMITREVNFIYLPVVNLKASVNLFSFIYDMLYTSVFDWNEDIDIINNLAVFVHGMPFFSALEIEKYILRVYPAIYKQVKRSKEGQSQTLNAKQWETESGSLYSLTGGLTQEEATAIIQPSEMPKSYLVRMNTQERAEISKEVFRIGKDYRYVDFPVGGNAAISRMHADIVKREDRYYIRDNNSTNRTYVNGIMIPGDQEVSIADGDRIVLANEAFEFHVEK